MTSTKWLNCRLSDIVEQLPEAYRVSRPVVSRLLRNNNYSLKANAKVLEKRCSPDRNQQFEYIYQQRFQHQQSNDPVLSIDTKKKELIGPFKNAGTHWCQTAEAVYSHDFPQDASARAVPYGIYDLTQNRGDVYIGHSADTPSFAVDNIVQWCQNEMPSRYPGKNRLMIEADAGGSNGYRSRVFKTQIQKKIANGLGITVTICHYPTGASKWNPIEHRLFSQISKTWAGCPLRSFEDMSYYIQQTTTETGLKVSPHRNLVDYPLGVKASNEEFKSLNINKHICLPQWNYTIYPQPTPNPDELV